jgi:hypothetical protein
MLDRDLIVASFKKRGWYGCGTVKEAPLIGRG